MKINAKHENYNLINMPKINCFTSEDIQKFVTAVSKII